MTQDLMIVSINPGVGKTTFTFALALHLRQMGRNVGYFKPISDRPDDTDAKDAKALLRMKEDLDIICPALVSSYEYDMTEKQRDEILKKIKAAHAKMRKNYEFLLIENCRRINYLSFLGLSSKDLAKEFKSDVLILTEGREVEDSDRILLGMNFFAASGIELVGAVMSLVPDQLLGHFQSVIVPTLENKFGVDVLGIISDRGNIAAPTVGELASALNAKILAAEDHLDNLVENYVIGAMMPEAALKYFRRSLNKAVITGGDRPQLALAAMETSTSALILTGGIIPPVSVLATAEDKGIPILLVNTDTYATIKIVTETPIYGKIHVEQADKIEAWAKILEQVDCEKIIEKLENEM